MVKSTHSFYYHEGFSIPHPYAPLGTYVDLLAHKNPSMTILEIGAGTGGATAPFLSTLTGSGSPKWSDYDYTDTSPAFFAKTQEKFKDIASRMNFKVLNIKNDPVQQGFGASLHDLMIAANVNRRLNSRQETGKQMFSSCRFFMPPEV